ncbi:MAG: c-type cytochrome biogenesis protein CcsB [Candidatus Nanopelagicales bacterium]
MMTINRTFAELSNTFVYMSMFVLALTLFVFAYAFSQTRDENAETSRRVGNIAMSLTWLSTLLLLVGVVLRGFSAGRAPWGNMYEYSITGTLLALVVFLIYSLKRDIRWLGLFVIIPALLSLGLAITVLYSESAQLIPALKSYWLIIHVFAAIVSGGLFTLGASVSGLQIVASHVEKKITGGENPGRLGFIAKRIPDSNTLDLFAYRIHAFVFPLWTFTVVAGAIWARSAWGRYWGWDPKETWAFITWVGYAAYMHARITIGWKGNKAATIALIAFATFIFNYFLVNIFFSGLHSYAGLD